MAHPVWYDSEERSLAHSGTRVRIHLKRSDHMLLSPDEIGKAVLAHYLPILTLAEFYESLKLIVV